MKPKFYRVPQMSAPKKKSWEDRVKSELPRSIKKTTYVRASLTHPSYRFENSLKNLEHFDRMEFFGDAILDYVICKRLYELFPNADEGELSRLRSTLVSKKLLSRVAKDLKIPGLIRLGKGVKRQGGLAKSKLISDAFESLIAAVYLGEGLEKTETFILKHFKPYIDPKRLLRLDPNPKSALQEICQKKWKRLPIYSSSLSKKLGIKTRIVIHSRMAATAYGKTRRISEEKAARLLLQKIRQESLRRSKKASSGRKLRKAD